MFLALRQAVFHVGGRFWARKNWHPKNLKIIFFQDKLYSLEAYVYEFTVLIYLATWRAAKRSVLTHFTFANLPRYSQSINSLYPIQIRSWLFMSAWSRRDRTSSYCCHPKKLEDSYLVFPYICNEKDFKVTKFWNIFNTSWYIQVKVQDVVAWKILILTVFSIKCIIYILRAEGRLSFE